MLLSKTISAEEYLAFERGSDEKHEFIFNFVVPKTASNRRHSVTSVNLLALIGNHLLNSENETYPSDMRVLNTANSSYFYPDVSVSDGVAKMIDNDILTNPQLIIEVLSDSTAVFDKRNAARTDKFIAYRTIPSLKEYILVSTELPQIEIFHKKTDDSWSVETIHGLENSAYFQSIDLKIALKDVYQRVF